MANSLQAIGISSSEPAAMPETPQAARAEKMRGSSAMNGALPTITRNLRPWPSSVPVPESNGQGRAAHHCLDGLRQGSGKVQPRRAGGFGSVPPEDAQVNGPAQFRKAITFVPVRASTGFETAFSGSFCRTPMMPPAGMPPTCGPSCGSRASAK